MLIGISIPILVRISNPVLIPRLIYISLFLPQAYADTDSYFPGRWAIVPSALWTLSLGMEFGLSSQGPWLGKDDP